MSITTPSSAIFTKRLFIANKKILLTSSTTQSIWLNIHFWMIMEFALQSRHTVF